VVGKLVRTISVNNNSAKLSIDLKAGVYFINVNKNGKVISSEKLVIL
jgi:hypothetical protein